MPPSQVVLLRRQRPSGAGSGHYTGSGHYRPDWACPNPACGGFKVFGSKRECPRCGAARDGAVASAPAPAPAPVSHAPAWPRRTACIIPCCCSCSPCPGGRLDGASSITHGIQWRVVCLVCSLVILAARHVRGLFGQLCGRQGVHPRHAGGMAWGCSSIPPIAR